MVRSYYHVETEHTCMPVASGDADACDMYHEFAILSTVFVLLGPSFGRGAIGACTVRLVSQIIHSMNSWTRQVLNS